MKANKFAVTIYTLVYNTKPFLTRCVESVLNQTFTEFEYILIDNGSTDGCKSYWRSMRPTMAGFG